MTESGNRYDLLPDLKELEQKIFEAINNTDCDLDTIFEALQGVMTFYMSGLCPDCRKNVARTLKRDIPRMLWTAKKFAAEHPQLSEHHHYH